MSIPKTIHKISLPTGFPVGDVNVYIIKDDPVTLIDTGVNGAIAEHVFTQNLKKIGLGFGDIKRIIITHTHLDHCGLAGRLQELSGASVYVHESKCTELASFNENFMRMPRDLRSFYMESAVPQQLLNASLRKRHRAVYLGSSVKNSFPLKEGTIFNSANLEFRTLYTPGHTDDMICLYETSNRLLFSSDHITPLSEPYIRFRELFKREDGDFGCLSSYINSLDRIAKLDITTLLPGHGDIIDNPADAIIGIKKFYTDRKERIVHILSRSVKSRFELSKALFGVLHHREILKGIPEVTGYLQMLESEGKLTKYLSNGIMYYQLKEEARCQYSK